MIIQLVPPMYRDNNAYNEGSSKKSYLLKSIYVWKQNIKNSLSLSSYNFYLMNEKNIIEKLSSNTDTQLQCCIWSRGQESIKKQTTLLRSSTPNPLQTRLKINCKQTREYRRPHLQPTLTAWIILSSVWSGQHAFFPKSTQNYLEAFIIRVHLVGEKRKWWGCVCGGLLLLGGKFATQTSIHSLITKHLLLKDT